MNEELERFATEVGLGTPAARALALAFSRHCLARVEHLIEQAEVLECLRALDRAVAGELDEATLAGIAQRAARLAQAHPGSASIDGCGHAAVSASHAVAQALAGRALVAAEYAAYAAVYAAGGYAAVADRDAFRPEFEWQLRRLRDLAARAR
jgi:hypothetical protein